MHNISTQIRGVREQMFLSRADFAALCGVSRRTIERLEQGSPARMQTIRRIAEALDLEPGAIAGTMPEKALELREVESEYQISTQGMQDVIGIRTWRKGQGITQQGLAELICRSQAYVSELERGIQAPSEDDLERLVAAGFVEAVAEAEEALRAVVRCPHCGKNVRLCVDEDM